MASDNKPVARLTLCRDNGRGAPSTFQDLGLLYESRNKPGVRTGRLSLVGDLTLHSGDTLSILVQPLERGGASTGDEPYDGQFDR